MVHSRDRFSGRVPPWNQAICRAADWPYIISGIRAKVYRTKSAISCTSCKSKEEGYGGGIGAVAGVEYVLSSLLEFTAVVA